MKYTIISAFKTDDLIKEVGHRLNLGWELHGFMSHVLYEKDVKFYQPMVHPMLSTKI